MMPAMVTSLEKNKNKKFHIYTLVGKTWTFIQRPSTVIKVKHHWNTEEEKPEDLRKGFGEGN